MISCKEASVVGEQVEETAPETTVPATTSPTTQETTPPTTEVVEAGPVEFEGVMINPIEGLRFENGTFYFLEGNQYGGEIGAEAGKFIKDAFEFNGQMENTIALRSEIIESLQEKGVREKKELRFPLPLANLKEKSGLKIDVFDDVAKNNPSSESNWAKVNFLEKCTYLGVSGIQNVITLCSPVKSLNKYEVGGAEWGGIVFNSFFPERNVNNTFSFIIYPDKELIENTFWK